MKKLRMKIVFFSYCYLRLKYVCLNINLVFEIDYVILAENEYLIIGLISMLLADLSDMF
jgi:hypothetical protein